MTLAARRLLVALLTITVLACAAETVGRDEWQKLSREDRLLYVHSLIGEEKAKDAKGGRGRQTLRPPEQYVQSIDQAYAGGDAREAHEIFAELNR